MTSLKGKRILVTREAKGAERFAEKIRAHQGEPLITPVLQINCLPVKQDTMSSIEDNNVDWIFFTSKNGVECFLQQDQCVDMLQNCRIAAVGPKTAQAIEKHGYHVDFIPSRYNAKTMSAEFLKQYEERGPVLFVRGTLSRPTLPETFSQVGRPFICLEVYETITHTSVKTLLDHVATEGLDLLTFTSPSAVEALINLASHPEKFREIPAACIGTTTGQRAKELGFKKTIVPEYFTIEGMLETMSDYFKTESLF